jgi:hypothetical protein
MVLTPVGFSHLPDALGYAQYGLIVLISLAGKALAKELKRYIFKCRKTASSYFKALPLGPWEVLAESTKAIPFD